MGGLSQMMSQAGASKEITEAAQDVEQMPGGMEMLFTTAADELGDDASQVRLFSMGGSYDQGGLSQATGGEDDEVLLHLSPEEFEAIEAMWGKADINGETGMPEYGFLKDAWKKVKGGVKKIVRSPIFQTIAPMALNYFMPGAGAAVGSFLGAGMKAAPLVGQAAIGAGFGALSGRGAKGALTGALTGAASAGAGKTIGAGLGFSPEYADIAGSALLGGAGSAVTGADPLTGALYGGAGAYLRPKVSGFLGERFPEQGIGKYGLEGGPPVDPFTGEPIATPSPTTGGLGQQPAPEEKSGLMDLALKYGVPAMALMSAGQGAQAAQPEAAGELPPDFLESLPQLEFDRPQVGLPSAQDYFTYGQVGAPQQGEAEFFESNVLPAIGGGGAPAEGGPPPAYETPGIQTEQPIDLSQFDVASGLRALKEGQLTQAGWTKQGNVMYPPQAPTMQAGGQLTEEEFLKYGQLGGGAEAEQLFFLNRGVGPGAGSPGGTPPATGEEGTAEAGGPLWNEYLVNMQAKGDRQLIGPRTAGAGSSLGDPTQYAIGMNPVAATNIGAGTPRMTAERQAALEAEGYTPGRGKYYRNYMMPPGYYDEAATSPEDEAKGLLRKLRKAGRGSFQRGGEFDFWDQNQDVPNAAPGVSAKGGRHYSGLGSGREDTIDARLSDGEYVMDSETVALLGDGSLDEGAARLDVMRENLRKHKAENLSKGKFSKSAKRPEKYMGKRRQRRRRRQGRRYEHGGQYPMSAGDFAKGGRVKVDEIVDAMAKELGV